MVFNRLLKGAMSMLSGAGRSGTYADAAKTDPRATARPAAPGPPGVVYHASHAGGNLFDLCVTYHFVNPSLEGPPGTSVALDVCSTKHKHRSALWCSSHTLACCLLHAYCCSVLSGQRCLLQSQICEEYSLQCRSCRVLGPGCPTTLNYCPHLHLHLHLPSKRPAYAHAYASCTRSSTCSNALLTTARIHMKPANACRPNLRCDALSWQGCQSAPDSTAQGKQCLRGHDAAALSLSGNTPWATVATISGHGCCRCVHASNGGYLATATQPSSVHCADRDGLFGR